MRQGQSNDRSQAGSRLDRNAVATHPSHNRFAYGVIADYRRRTGGGRTEPAAQGRAAVSVVAMRRRHRVCRSSRGQSSPPRCRPALPGWKNHSHPREMAAPSRVPIWRSSAAPAAGRTAVLGCPRPAVRHDLRGAQGRALSISPAEPRGPLMKGAGPLRRAAHRIWTFTPRRVIRGRASRGTATRGKPA
jgi:hypothetical protein